MHWWMLGWSMAIATPSELEREAQRSAPLIEACRQSPAVCAGRRDEIAHALFVDVLQDWVSEGKVDRQNVANLKVLDPDRLAKLPPILTESTGQPEPWAQQARNPAPKAKEPADAFDPGTVTEVTEAIARPSSPPPKPPARAAEAPEYALDPASVEFRLAPRTIKIDVFLLEPGIRRLPEPFVPTTMEQWTAALRCSPVTKNRERCTFVDGVWWGVVLQNNSQFNAKKLPAPDAIEFVWTKRDTRVLGEFVESQLAQYLGGAIDWERPKPNWKSGPYALAQAPGWTPWLQPSVAKPKLVVTSKAADADRVELELRGTVTESASMGSALNSSSTSRVAAWAMVTKGVLTHAMTERAFSSNNTRMVGYKRAVTIAQPYVYGAVLPADLPPPLLNEGKSR